MWCQGSFSRKRSIQGRPYRCEALCEPSCKASPLPFFQSHDFFRFQIATYYAILCHDSCLVNYLKLLILWPKIINLHRMQKPNLISRWAKHINKVKKHVQVYDGYGFNKNRSQWKLVTISRLLRTYKTNVNSHTPNSKYRTLELIIICSSFQESK